MQTDPGSKVGYGMLRVSTLVAMTTALVVTVAGGMFYAGYHSGTANAPTGTDVVLDQLRGDWERERQALAEARDRARNEVDALTMRLGRLQAQVIRVEALGERVAEMSRLDTDEFDFSRPPAQGGPASASDKTQQVAVADFIASLEQVAAQLEQREDQLLALENLLMNDSLAGEVRPEGRPTNSGWISSFYGKRTDPFTGHKEHHAGMDFAGREGSDVVAVAAGVVSWAGSRSGYGNLIEINHGSGYTTRYGHNKEHLVEVGDAVTKGQVIARMGSVGRSTGPHVHFEVIRNGNTVNPEKYVRVSRK